MLCPVACSAQPPPCFAGVGGVSIEGRRLFSAKAAELSTAGRNQSKSHARGVPRFQQMRNLL